MKIYCVKHIMIERANPHYGPALTSASHRLSEDGYTRISGSAGCRPPSSSGLCSSGHKCSALRLI